MFKGAMKEKIAVVGVGYVGLPLAVALAKFYRVVAFDLNQTRISELKSYYDSTKEIASADLLDVQNNLQATDEPHELAGCNFFIITVPTPINAYSQPDLLPLQKASEMIGRFMPNGSIVVVESTLFPGATERICLPLLESGGKVYRQDFQLGYSPERVSPGDASHSLKKVVKIIAGDCLESQHRICKVYEKIIDGGIYLAPSIKVAEASKLLENVQRDVNIALMNESAKIFDALGISTSEVLAAASTKWNFAPFYPGLVGGHCIAVDPYYLIAIAEENRVSTPLLQSSRLVNESMTSYIACKIFDALRIAGISSQTARIGVLGLTFKENVPDIRNSKVVDLINLMKKSGCKVLAHDPCCQESEVFDFCGLELVGFEELTCLDVLVLAVPHNFYKGSIDALLVPLRDRGFFADLKGVYERDNQCMPRQIKYWSL